MTTEIGKPFTEMTAEEFQDHLDQRSVNTRDAAAVARWFGENGVQRRLATGEVAVGRAAVEGAMAATFEAFPDFHLEVRDLFTAGNRTCVECTFTGTHKGDLMGIPATGRQVEGGVCLVFRWDDDGLVEEENVYFDNASILMQIGVLPAPAAAPAT